MSPLDLTQAPPRSPKMELRGLCMLPRMIDIARAKLRGGRLGEYQIGRGMSAVVLAKLGVSGSEFTQLTAESSDDDDLAGRLLSRETDMDLAELNARLRGITVADVPAELRPEFERFYGAHLPSDRSVFDVLEADDNKTFRGTNV